MSLLTPDEDVIACHDGVNSAKWSKDCRCSHCGSMHPYDFADLIEKGEVLNGWHFEGTVPLYCDTQAGRFFGLHLCDMSAEWLAYYQAEIAIATGVVWYWKHERLLYKSFVGSTTLGPGDKVPPSVVAKIRTFIGGLK